jgi:hypothetical protein
VSRISLSARYRRRTADECTYYVPTSGNLTGAIGLERTKTGLNTEGTAAKQFDSRRLQTSLSILAKSVHRSSEGAKVGLPLAARATSGKPVPSLRSVTVGVVLRQVGVALRARPRALGQSAHR